MSKRAEEAALKAYPEQDMYSSLLDGSNRLKREVFIKGYELAEKDLGWISVKDRLPEENGWYFTCVEQAGVAQCVGVTYFDLKEWTDDDDSTELVDYWMEIPALPNKK